jgi:hypothetical protein
MKVNSYVIVCWGYQFLPLSTIFSIEFWTSSNSVLFLEHFRQCAIFLTVPTVCYLWISSHSVLFWEQFMQFAIFETVPTLWFFFHCMTSLILITLTNIPSAALLYSSVLNDKIIWLFSVNIRAFQTLSIILISCYIRNEYAIATSDKAVFRNTKEINVIDQNVQ